MLLLYTKECRFVKFESEEFQAGWLRLNPACQTRQKTLVLSLNCWTMVDGIEKAVSVFLCRSSSSSKLWKRCRCHEIGVRYIPMKARAGGNPNSVGTGQLIVVGKPELEDE